LRRAVAIAAVAVGLAAPTAALAQDCPQTTLGDIEDEVMCPVCGTPLGLASEAPQAIQQREYIEELIADCRSKDEIKRALVAQFGEAVLALPGDEGDDGIEDVLVYLIPGIALVVAAGGIAIALTRWRRREPRAAGGTVAGSGRVDEDMERYDL
jgi:cytochrome c-type biogenesis protein CcmH/NrfF